MLPQEILKFSFSKMHILCILKRDLMKKWTETYGENFMCLAVIWYLFQYSNRYIQIIGFQMVKLHAILWLSVAADEISIIPN